MSNYGFEIEIDRRKEQDSFYIGYLNRFILNSIGEYIDRTFQILNSEKIFEIDDKNIIFSLNVKKTEDKLYGEIRTGTVKELQHIYISRMEDLKFNNPEDKATFKERLEILFTGKVKGGRTKLIEVKKSELEKENEKYKNFKLHINGMRSGKELLIKYINDSVLKDKIRDKIKELDKMVKEIYKHRKQQRYTLNEIQAIKGILKELEGE